jgi:hypothetical protein
MSAPDLQKEESRPATLQVTGGFPMISDKRG